MHSHVIFSHLRIEGLFLIRLHRRVIKTFRDPIRHIGQHFLTLMRPIGLGFSEGVGGKLLWEELGLLS